MPWIFPGQVHVSFQLPPNRTLTVALLPFRCLNNRLPFSVYSYLQEGWLLATSTRRSDPTRVVGESFLFSRQRPCLALQHGVLARLPHRTAMSRPDSRLPCSAAFPPSTFLSRNARRVVWGKGCWQPSLPSCPRQPLPSKEVWRSKDLPVLSHSLCTRQLARPTALPCLWSYKQGN